MSTTQFQKIAWGLSIGVSVLAFVSWGQLYDWRLAQLSSYQYFPLFGLLAFSLMWSHYIVSALRQYLGLDRAVLRAYFDRTSLFVLFALLAHPGLLGWQLWRDGEGLPPASELNYAGESLKVAVILGMIAWMVFLSYEFRRKYSTQSWWKYVNYANDAAMVMIIIHSLRLGSHLQSGWFRAVWYFYAATFVGSLAYIYTKRLKKPLS